MTNRKKVIAYLKEHDIPFNEVVYERKWKFEEYTNFKFQPIGKYEVVDDVGFLDLQFFVFPKRLILVNEEGKKTSL